MIELRPETLTDFAAEVARGETFTFSRYGDGEWICILGKKPRGQNCNGDAYTPELQKALIESFLFRDSSYRPAVSPMALRVAGKEIEEWLKIHHLQEKFYSAGILPKAQIRAHRNGLRFELLNIFESLPLVVVGPAHLQPLTKTYRIVEFIETPKQNAFRSHKQTLQKVVSSMKKGEGRLYSFSVGMAACPLLSESHQYAKDRHWAWDVGSVLDPVVGLSSRAYHAEILGVKK